MINSIYNEKIENITPYNKNAKEHPTSQIKKIANSIKAFGFNQPIVLDEKGVIVVGHGRYEASKLLNLSEVPCIKVKLSDKKAKAYRLADNKLNESKWNMDLVIDELKLLDDEDIILTGFDLDLATNVKEDDFDEEAELEKIKKPESKRGDIYQLGDHRLMCGDSTSEKDVELLMNGEKARMIFTDPSYNVNYKSPGGLDYNSNRFGGTGGKIKNDNMSDDSFKQFCVDILNNLYKFTTDDCSIYWWFANKNNHINRIAFEESGWKMSQIIVWLKNSMVYSMGQDYHRQYEPCMFGWKDGKSHFRNKKINNLKDIFNLDFDDFNEMLDVWYEKRDITKNYVHPTQKPLRLPERGIKKNSERGDIIIDLFGGSGSTLMACEQLGRKARLMEMDERYCDVIIKRYEKSTGRKVKKIS